MEHQKVSPIKFLAVDLAVGTLSSFVQLIVGYPLDFLKTRMQIYGGGIRQISSIIKNEGLRAFYRGLTSPLVGAMVSGSVYFSSYEFARRQFTSHSNKQVNDFLPTPQIFLCGSFAGSMADIFNIPLEFAKIQIQKQQTNKSVCSRKGPFHVLKTIAREKGFIHVYKGCSLQLSRDFIGCGFFFSFYELTLQHFTPEGKTRKDVSRQGVLLAGLAAGSGFWTLSYPLDILKTRIQSDDINNPKYKSISSCFKDVYNQGGVKAFYKGYSITIFRSMLVNVISLSVYENLHRIGYGLLE